MQHSGFSITTVVKHARNFQTESEILNPLQRMNLLKSMLGRTSMCLLGSKPADATDKTRTRSIRTKKGN